MKKIKIITVLLTISIMLMGVGYAAWNKGVSIETTSTTGKFDIAFDKGTVKVYSSDSATVVDGIDRTADVSVNGDVGTATVTNLYPGAKAIVTIPITNNSTIPVKMKNVNATSGSNFDVSISSQETTTLDVNEKTYIEITVRVKDGALQDKTAKLVFGANFEQFNK